VIITAHVGTAPAVSRAQRDRFDILSGQAFRIATSSQFEPSGGEVVDPKGTGLVVGDSADMIHFVTITGKNEAELTPTRYFANGSSVGPGEISGE
jgi:hypothetical protein